LLSYFNARYPNTFKGGQQIVPENADTDDYNNTFGAAHDAAIRRNIPVINDTRAIVGWLAELSRDTYVNLQIIRLNVQQHSKTCDRVEQGVQQDCGQQVVRPELEPAKDQREEEKRDRRRPVRMDGSKQ
jgi:hypothetical protein